MRKNGIQLLLMLALLAVSGMAQTGNPLNGGNQNSQQGPSGGERQGPHRPPPQALAACEGKASGAECSFTGRRNETLTGTCFAPRGGPEGGEGQSAPPLACRPAHAPGGGGENGKHGPGGPASQGPGSGNPGSNSPAPRG